MFDSRFLDVSGLYSVAACTDKVVQWLRAAFTHTLKKAPEAVQPPLHPAYLQNRQSKRQHAGKLYLERWVDFKSPTESTIDWWAWRLTNMALKFTKLFLWAQSQVVMICQRLWLRDAESGQCDFFCQMCVDEVVDLQSAISISETKNVTFWLARAAVRIAKGASVWASGESAICMKKQAPVKVVGGTTNANTASLCTFHKLQSLQRRAGQDFFLRVVCHPARCKSWLVDQAPADHPCLWWCQPLDKAAPQTASSH